MTSFTDFVNFLENGNRYEVENFSVYLTFNGLSNDISHVVVAQNFIICTCLSYVDIVCVFLRNRVFVIRQKYPLANFLILLFLAYLSEHSWWYIPVDLFCFFKLQDMDSSSYSFMVMYDKRLGIRIKQRTPNTAALP